MPPRASLTSSFSVTDVNNEVVCPLRNQDASSCRKRCLGEKRYRSMQEHIRRAHPEYYLPKLPATKESFELMITSPPHERPALDPNHANHHNAHSQQQHHHPPPPVQHVEPPGLSPAFGLDTGLGSSFEGYHNFGQPHDGGYYTANDTEAAQIYNSMQAQQRSSDDYRRGSLIPAVSAAAALAQLHYHRSNQEWGDNNNMPQNYLADPNSDFKPDNFHVDPALEDPTFMHDHHDFPVSSSSDQPGLLPSSMARSPPDKSTTQAPLQRSMSRQQYNRPRKTSLSHQARMAKHERKKSREAGKRSSGERKNFTGGESAATLYGKRWEDLIDAAASATEEEGSRDLTPIPASPYQSPHGPSRTSMPPFAQGSQFQSFQASPLNRALTPPAPDPGLTDLQPFASVDSSLSSTMCHHQHHPSTDSTGSQFHIMNPASLTTPSESSPMFHQPASNHQPHQPQHQQSHSNNSQSGATTPTQIYCSGCKRLSLLRDAFACTNCICGVCSECVQAILSGQSHGRMSTCPCCNAMDSTFKPFQLDIRWE